MKEIKRGKIDKEIIKFAGFLPVHTPETPFSPEFQAGDGRPRYQGMRILLGSLRLVRSASRLGGLLLSRRGSLGVAGGSRRLGL
jgi:hypothetical protein